MQASRLCGKHRGSLRLALLAICALALLMAGCGRRSSTSAVAVRVVNGHQEQPIGQSTPNARSVVGFANDTGCYVAYEEEAQISPLLRWISLGRRKPASRVVFNGQPGPWFEKVVWMGFPFEDGRLFVIAGAGKRMYLYEGLRQIGAYDEFAWAFGSSKDGKTLAYAARRGHQWFIVRNGQEMLVSGKAVTDLVLSPDGNKIAYVVEQGGKQTIVADGKPVGSFQKAFLFFISNDGRRLVYMVKQGGSRFLVTDGKPSAPCTHIRWLSLADDGQVQAYVAQSGSKQSMVWRGRRSPPYDEIGSPSLSRDGRQLAYPAQVGNRWVVMVNGQKRGSYEKVASVRISEDGSMVAAAVLDGGHWFVIVNGHREGPYDSVEPPLVSYSTAAPTSSAAAGSGRMRLGYAAAVGGKWFVVVDSERSAPYDRTFAPIFSHDGQHVAFRAVKGNKGLVILDGQEGPLYDYIAAGPAFRKDGSLEYLAVRGDTLYRVTVPVNLSPGAPLSPR